MFVRVRPGRKSGLRTVSGTASEALGCPAVASSSSVTVTAQSESSPLRQAVTVTVCGHGHVGWTAMLWFISLPDSDPQALRRGLCGRIQRRPPPPAPPSQPFPSPSTRHPKLECRRGRLDAVMSCRRPARLAGGPLRASVCACAWWWWLRGGGACARARTRDATRARLDCLVWSPPFLPAYHPTPWSVTSRSLCHTLAARLRRCARRQRAPEQGNKTNVCCH